MSIEQTVEIPASLASNGKRQLTIDVPPEVPAGRVVLSFTPVREEAEDETEYLLRSPANRERLTKAINDAENGRNLISFDSLEDAIQCVQDKLPR